MKTVHVRSHPRRRPTRRGSEASPQSKMQDCLLKVGAVVIFLFLLAWLLSRISPLILILIAVVIVVVVIAILALMIRHNQAYQEITMVSQPSRSLKPDPPPPQPKAQSQLPKTLAEVYSSFSSTEFEIFSAAVVVGLGEGHQFVAHSGKRGDRGVDFRLHNAYGNNLSIELVWRLQFNINMVFRQRQRRTICIMSQGFRHSPRALCPEILVRTIYCRFYQYSLLPLFGCGSALRGFLLLFIDIS